MPGEVDENAIATTDETEESQAAGDETQEDETTESSTAEVQDDDEVEDDEIVEEVDPETLSLAKLLSNPSTREATIRALSKDVQSEVSAGKTPQEAVKSVGAMLKQHFGKDWEFMADKLTPIFDYMLNYMAGLEGKLTASENARLEQASRVAANQFYKDHPEAKKFEGKIVELMSKYDPAPGMDQVEYLEGLYTIARGGKSTLSTELGKKVQSRVDRNASAARPKGGTAATAATKVEKMDLNSAIAAAVKKTNFKG